eukprot:gnl/Chilomastix_cuspidata/544.p1 GENE.gnl/Chilomastix_cuspidata/544~~gnl/Chilomastix_cuspidata/544.p1  ORF type:complete len:196 (-),score=36.19 gnl/Chilomastix_cuspidata/544:43-630(-)
MCCGLCKCLFKTLGKLLSLILSIVLFLIVVLLICWLILAILVWVNMANSSWKFSALENYDKTEESTGNRYSMAASVHFDSEFKTSFAGELLKSFETDIDASFFTISNFGGCTSSDIISVDISMDDSVKLDGSNPTNIPITVDVVLPTACNSGILSMINWSGNPEFTKISVLGWGFLPCGPGGMSFVLDDIDASIA